MDFSIPMHTHYWSRRMAYVGFWPENPFVSEIIVQSLLQGAELIKLHAREVRPLVLQYFTASFSQLPRKQWITYSPISPRKSGNSAWNRSNTSSWKNNKALKMNITVWCVLEFRGCGFCSVILSLSSSYAGRKKGIIVKPTAIHQSKSDLKSWMGTIYPSWISSLSTCLDTQATLEISAIIASQTSKPLLVKDFSCTW